MGGGQGGGVCGQVVGWVLNALTQPGLWTVEGMGLWKVWDYIFSFRKEVKEFFLAKSKYHLLMTTMMMMMMTIITMGLQDA